MTTDTKAVARWYHNRWLKTMVKAVDGDYVEFTDHKKVVAELRSTLAAKSAEVEGLRAVLAVIADMHAEKDSAEGFNEWGEADCFHQARDLAKAAMEKSNEHQDQ